MVTQICKERICNLILGLKELNVLNQKIVLSHAQQQRVEHLTV